MTRQKDEVERRSVVEWYARGEAMAESGDGEMPAVRRVRRGRQHATGPRDAGGA